MNVVPLTSTDCNLHRFWIDLYVLIMESDSYPLLHSFVFSFCSCRLCFSKCLSFHCLSSQVLIWRTRTLGQGQGQACRSCFAFFGSWRFLLSKKLISDAKSSHEMSDLFLEFFDLLMTWRGESLESLRSYGDRYKR